jgi:hypothetical protein
MISGDFRLNRPLVARDRLKPSHGVRLHATASWPERAQPRLLYAALFLLAVGSIASQGHDPI